MKQKSTSKTYMRGVKDWEMIFIKKEKEEYYLSIKKINKIDKSFVVQECGKSMLLIDDGYYIIEFTPINEFYNARVFIDENKNVLGYYFDITLGNGEIDNIPYYNDLYLDVVYFPSENNLIEVLDEDELLGALNEGQISKKQYNLAKQVGSKLIEEIKSNKNTFINMDKNSLIKKYFK